MHNKYSSGIGKVRNYLLAFPLKHVAKQILTHNSSRTSQTRANKLPHDPLGLWANSLTETNCTSSAHPAFKTPFKKETCRVGGASPLCSWRSATPSSISSIAAPSGPEPQSVTLTCCSPHHHATHALLPVTTVTQKGTIFQFIFKTVVVDLVLGGFGFGFLVVWCFCGAWPQLISLVIPL